MAAPEIRTRRGLDERRSSSRGPTDSMAKGQSKLLGNEKTKEKTVGPMDRWVEPALDDPKPSYQDQGAEPQGVFSTMQPLGQTPNDKVKAIAKADGLQKSVFRQSSAAVGVDDQETPEGSPAPMTGPPQPAEAQAPQHIAGDDKRDGDYAPRVNENKLGRSTRSRAVKRKSEAASAVTQAPASKKQTTSASTTSTPAAPTSEDDHKFEYDTDKLGRVVQAAKDRALEVGKPDLAAAVNEIYEQSLTNHHLRILLEAILTQTAIPSQSLEFQNYVRAAKKKLKDAKSQTRLFSAATNGAQSPTSKLSLQSSRTSSFVPGTSIAVPSTEAPEMAKPKLSLKVKSPTKRPHRRRAANATASTSPLKKQSGNASDSSLTSLTSNEADSDLEVAGGGTAGPPSKANGVKGKKRAIEPGPSSRSTKRSPTDAELEDDRDSTIAAKKQKISAFKSKDLAAERGTLKRSSAEAELEEERDRALASKKQKLTETITRDFQYEESNVRKPMPAPRSRARQLRDGAAAPLSLRTEANGSRAASVQGNGADSVDSPLSELTPGPSRQGTPRAAKAVPNPTGKRAKTKQSPQKKPTAVDEGMAGASGAVTDSPIGEDDNEEASENNDFCAACGTSGWLLCCDGCERSFHFGCLDPPIHEDAKELDEPWYCFICVANRPSASEPAEKSDHGLFANLFDDLKMQNPKNFELPADIRNYFENVTADDNGSFVEIENVTKPTRSRPGYTGEQADPYRLRDSKGNFVLCYHCGGSSEGKRQITTCDYCNQHWHLDCLNPPLANLPVLTNSLGKKVHNWMCPLHAEQELRHIALSQLTRREIHFRKPKNTKVVDASLKRGTRNNGYIEVIDDDADASDSEFYDHDGGGTVYKLPAQGIKLDFIDHVKHIRAQQLRDERVQRLREVAAACKCGRHGYDVSGVLEQANFAKRPFNEQQVALQLAQFANESPDLDFGNNQVENLVGTLIAEAPSQVVDQLMGGESSAEKIESTTAAPPPSPPTSEQTDQLSAEQRKELELLQELIRRKLDTSKT